jgi:hypothetical protein
MSNPWFRMYSEFSHDPKVQMLSEAMQRRYIMLMCLRCSNSLVTLHAEEVAFQLRISNEDLTETKALFIAKGFIDSEWNLLNWEKRQFASDTSKARVAKYRVLQKEKQKEGGNDHVTLQKQKSNALDTDTDTDTDKKRQEKKKSASAPTIPEISESLMADFQKIRRSKKAPLTDTAINGLRREAEKAGVTMTEAITACCEFGWQGFNADWYAERTASKAATAGNPPTESFAERDARTKRENWEVMTNRKWPEQDLPQSARSSAIDAAAFELPNNIRRLTQ